MLTSGGGAASRGWRRRQRQRRRRGGHPSRPCGHHGCRHHGGRNGTCRSGGGNVAKFGGGGGDGTVKIGFTAPLTGALAGFGEANDFILAGIQELVADGIMLGTSRTPSSSSSRTSVELRHRRTRKRAADPRRRRRHDHRHGDARDDQPRCRPVRGQRRAMPRRRWRHGSRTSSDAVATRPPGSTGRITSSGAPTQLVGGVHRPVELDRDQQDGWPAVPQRPRRQRARRSRDWLPGGRDAAGYTVVDPGRFQTGTADFSSIIGQFKDEGVEILVGIPIPPDFATFWTQAKQQDFNPKIVHDGQGRAVPVGGRGARRHRRRPGLRGVVDADPPLHQFAHRHLRAGIVRRVHGGHRQAVDAVRRLRARPARGGLDSSPEPGAPTSRRWPTRSAATNLDTIVGPLTFGRPDCRRTSAPRRSSVASGKRRSREHRSRSTCSWSTTAPAPEIPVGGNDRCR